MADPVPTLFPLPLAILKDDVDVLQRAANPELRRERLEFVLVTAEEPPQAPPEQIVAQSLELLKDPDLKKKLLGLKVALITMDRFPNNFNWEKRVELAKSISDHVRKNSALTPYLFKIILKTSQFKWTTIPEMTMLILVEGNEHSSEFLQTLHLAQEQSGPERRDLIGLLLKDLERQGNFLGLGTLDAYSFSDSYGELGARAWYGHRWNRFFEWRSEGSASWLNTSPESKKNYQFRLGTGPAFHWPQAIGDGKWDPYVSAVAGLFYTGAETQYGFSLTAGPGLQYFFSDRWLLDGAVRFVSDIPFSGKINVGLQVPFALTYRF